MKNKKKILPAIISLLVVFAIVGSIAYMSDSDNAINKLSYLDQSGVQPLDVALNETKLKSMSGYGSLFGTAIPRNPSVKNTKTTDAYVFATVAIPVKAVAVQNSSGEIVGVDGEKETSIAYHSLSGKYYDFYNKSVELEKDELSKIKYIYEMKNNIEDGTESKIDADNYLVAIYKDEKCENQIKYNEPLLETVYMKVKYVGNDQSIIDQCTKEGDSLYYIVEDTINSYTGLSKKTMHQFVWTYTAVKGNAENRELFTIEADVGGEADRTISVKGIWSAINGTTPSGEKIYTRALSDDDSGFAKLANVNCDEGEWIEITETYEDTGANIYVGDDGQIYAAHLFFYTKVLAPGEETPTIFDYVEVLNVTDAQVNSDDDINIYIDAYGIQVKGITEAINKTDPLSDDGAKLMWNVLTNALGGDNFNLFRAASNASKDYKELSFTAQESTTQEEPITEEPTDEQTTEEEITKEEDTTKTEAIVNDDTTKEGTN